jgi:hypothetical protein
MVQSFHLNDLEYMGADNFGLKHRGWTESERGLISMFGNYGQKSSRPHTHDNVWSTADH